MIGGRAALLVGLFLAPAILLWLGHRLREGSPTRRSAFWGGIAGHTLALAATMLASVSPPLAWAGGSAWRELIVHWSLVIGPAAGAAAGAAVGRRRR